VGASARDADESGTIADNVASRRCGFQHAGASWRLACLVPIFRPMTAALIFWLVVLALGAAVTLYSYFGYPALLWLQRALGRRQPPVPAGDLRDWPRISITLPAYNAEATLRPVLEGLIRIDYPRDRRQILVVSDGSTDGTDDLVREFAPQGVELLRVEGRLGKTEVENRAMDALTGDIIINTDASVTVHPAAIKRLVAALGDPSVGVASGRDISVASVGETGSGGEAAYVGYEMWVRALETDVESIVGSSGCLYAVRAPLHRRKLPGHLSRDFSSALWARMNGVRAVSVNDAICYVPRAASMRVEYRRKVRTMSRGIQTLFFHGALLNPLRAGLFAWLLWSHKLVRWLVPWALASGAVALVAIALIAVPAAPLTLDPRALSAWAVAGAAALLAGLLLAALGWWWPGKGTPPRLASMAAFFVSGTVAGIVAWVHALRDRRAPVWEPTPRAVSERRGTPVSG
jgi:cellulose synthase/poly-beta-1,6-N-acetylglucosamine synthase-like glycosyltransferase